MKIHPTAIVDSHAELDGDVEVQAYSIIGPHVQIGAGTVVGPHCVINGRTVLGKNNRIFSGAQIGVLSQDLKHNLDYQGRTIIGDNNQFREHVTVSASTVTGEADQDNATIIGSGGLFMASSHIGHESVVGDNVIMANCVALAGHVTIQDKVIIGGLSGVHQFCSVGTMAIVGGMVPIRTDAPPYFVIEGHPERCRGVNTIGLDRNGVPKETQRLIRKMYKILYLAGLNTSQALERIEAEVPACPERDTLVTFVRSSKRGITRSKHH
jgi:UDP-N-acetylglucosamine acyltransferase